MIITSSGTALDSAPGPGRMILAAVDVEWTKNYRVKDGNVPFCYSAVWLQAPESGAPCDLGEASFSWISAYVDTPADTEELVTSADSIIARILDQAGVIAGHQLCSDLAILARAASGPLQAVTRLRAAWHRRHLSPAAGPRVIDTRYDIGHLLSGPSRRLVDVCGELRLDVTQPELRGTSMTALHRRWTETGDATAREKISVLNLRHSLSTVLAAACAAGPGHSDGGLNVNQMLAAGLSGRFGWTAGPAFRALLEDRR